MYAYEGIGIVLPVQAVTKNKEQYPTIVAGVIGFVASLYVGFGLFCISVYGDDIMPIVTDNVFNDGSNFKLFPDWISYCIIGLFCVNLFCTYPLVLYPAHIIIEQVLYRGWPKTKKRQCSKNVTRSLLVGLTVGFTLW